MGSRSADLDVDAAAIEGVAKALEVPLAPGVRDSLALWLAELVRWNKAHDLTAARSKDELLDLMLADALVLSRMIAKDATVVDVGSGAGAPGLPLSILRPDLSMTLVEPLQKRVGFLRLVLGTLDRLDVKLEAKRGDALPEGAWDVAISRATLAPDAWLALGTRLVKAGGEVVLLLARDAPPVKGGWSAEPPVDYVWPLTQAVRSAVRYR